MKLAAWARQQGLDYKTGIAGSGPGFCLCPRSSWPTRTILVESVPLAEKRGAAVYARVASGDQKKDLERQLARLVEHSPGSVYCEVRLRDRLGTEWTSSEACRSAARSDDRGDRRGASGPACPFRLGVHRSGLQSTGRKVVVVNEKERKDDLVPDLIEVLTSFCARRYGRRSAKNKAKKAMEAIEHA